jgi:hypothetical protein
MTGHPLHLATPAATPVWVEVLPNFAVAGVTTAAPWSTSSDGKDWRVGVESWHGQRCNHVVYYLSRVSRRRGR